MTITRGKVHKYLGVIIHYSFPCKLIFSMAKYIGNMLDDIPEDIKGGSATPDSQHPFDIAKDTTNLSQIGSDLFHHFVAQLLYISKSSRPDIQISVSFRCTIVIEPDTYYYKNQVRVMNHIQGTIGLPLIISINKSGNIRW